MIGILALALSIPTPLVPLAQAAQVPGRPEVPASAPVKVHAVTEPGAKKERAKVAQDRAANRRLSDLADQERARNVWPKAQTLSGRLTPAPASDGTALVHLRGVERAGEARFVQHPASGTSTVKVLDQKAARAAGVTGVLFTVAAQGAGAAQVEVDYSSFGSAIGGAWATRLGLVSFPVCALTTPQKAECRKTTLISSQNKAEDQTVTANLAQVNAAPQVLALTATTTGGSDKGAGDYKATPLASSSSWEAGGSSGSFTWSYPISVPPAAAGPAPSLGLSYDSGSVDGRTANTNNQGSLVGEGFDLTSSYIERKYGSCDDDGQTGKHDQCWKYENASLVLNGKATELVKDDTSNHWRLKNDDASIVTHATGADNADEGDDGIDGAGEYWKVVTGNGTTYTFGLNKLAGAGTERTNSVWTVPVFGDDAGEPGYSSGTSPSGRAKQQAWRWNLDLVEDIHGNASTYWYEADTNYYAKNGDKTALAKYTRGGYLHEIRYGQRSDTLFTGTASGKVTFDHKERCKDIGGGCDALTEDTAKNWPDVPFDSICTASETDCKAIGPAFFTRKILTGINTHVWSTAAEPDAYQPVDTYTLTQDIFDGQDIGNSSDQVWTLTGLKRTGKNGTALALPTIGFTYQQRANRVEQASTEEPDNVVPLTRPRISTITSETGAITTVALSEPDCLRGSRMPVAEDNNTLSCYPVYWPVNGGDPQLDWFNKYRVIAVTTADTGGRNVPVENAYTYEGPAWHYNDDPFTKEKERTWSSWRGYQKVTAHTGAAGNTRSKTVSLYMQGMHGDRRLAKDANGNPLTKSVTIPGIDIDNIAGNTGDEVTVGNVTDSEQYAGQLRQQIAYNGTLAVGNQVNDLWYKQTASQQKSYAHITAGYVRTAGTYSNTYLTAAKKWRTTAVSTTYDGYGMAIRSDNHGDWSTAGDETCTRTWYTRNDAKGLTSLVSRTRTVGQACSVTDDLLKMPTSITHKYTSTEAPDQRGDILSDTAVVYDDPTATGWTADQTLTLGLPTWTGRAKGYPAAVTGNTADRHPTGWQTLTKVTYDGATAKLGRPLTVTDAAGKVTTTAYVPATTGPLTATIVTKPTLANGQAHRSYTYYDPARGSVTQTLDANLKRIENTYDALGRITATWAPNRSKSGGDTATATFDYGINQTKDPSWTSVSTLKADGQSYTTSYSLFDSLLRPLQTQTPAPNGGRILTDTRYNDRGLAYETYADVFDSTTAPDSTYSRAEYGGAPQQYNMEFDGLGRPVKSTLLVKGVPKFNPVVTTYTGDSVATTAQQGGTASRTITDPLGRTTETRTYAGTQPDDTAYGGTLGTSYTSVKYGYFRDGKQKQVTGPDNAKWSYTYDLYGRQDTATDPDKGTSSTSYTDLDQIQMTKDAEQRVLVYGYDEIGRKTGLWQNSATDANRLAEWTYDAILKGLPDASIRYTGGKGQTGSKTYTKKVTSYDSMSRPTTTTLTLPADDALVTTGAVTATTTAKVSYRLDGTVGSTTEPAGGGLTGEIVSTNYNPYGLPIGLSGTSGYLQGASYTDLGQVQQLIFGTSSAVGTKKVFLTNFYEEGTGRLTDADVDDQTRGAVRDTAYTYDPAGNVTSIFDHANTGNGADFQCFTYDGQRRMTEAWTPKTAACATTGRTVANIGGAAPYWTSYTYNTAGQRATEKQNTTTPVTRTYCYNTPRTHALKATTTDGNCTDETTRYTYDATGNTTARVETAGSTTTQSLTWSAEGKLTKLTEGTSTTDYLYDADGELLIRRASGTSGETVLYLGATEVHLKGTKKWANRYYTAAGSTIALRTNETGTEKLHFLAADHHGTGNLSLTGDVTQALTKRYTTPFGAARGTTSGTWPDDKAFLDKTADTGTNLTHIGAREYDPTLGQFVSVDPLLTPDAPGSMNGYSYAGNNPATTSDPTGMCAEVDCPTRPGAGFENTTPGVVPGPPKPDATTLATTSTGDSSGTAATTGGGGSPKRFYKNYGSTPVDQVFYGTIRNVADFASLFGWIADGDCWGGNGSGQSGAGAPGCDYGSDYDQWMLEQGVNTGSDWYQVPGFIGAMLAHREAGAGGGFGLSKRLPTGGQCFLAGTLVLMADGTKKEIQDVEVGDKVLATDPETGESGARPVTQLIRTQEAKHLNTLSIATPDGAKNLTATAEHPFWSPSQHAWVAAKDLQPGMTLLTDKGNTVVVKGNNSSVKYVKTYNFTVADLHTYYVLAGNTPVLVHNKCGEVPYNGNELSSAAYNARVAAGISPGRNVAVARVPGWNNPKTGDLVIGFSKGNGYHSENHILDQLAAKGVKPDKVSHLYSERQPCPTCGPMLDGALSPGTPVSWSVPWGSDATMNAASNELLRQMIAAAGGR
ncbi:polymorphic toxin-type HINT domain-containing protein [Streptomyces sp. CB02261]|uniref:polymorphic toxin-type HINT domain-containing protein n=1 Tax=Streptomyces sp. CB02261 TaxID=1703940 RepID=UPI001F51C9DF|nr:polymorphic toxin-type HINT domain-containing protein [Streptomyces sp. CB02261]